MIAAFTLAQILSYPFPAALVRDKSGTAIAYALDTQGLRTLWFARAPQWTPVQVFSSGSDDGQELSNLAISNDDSHVVYVRGGDHDENWQVPLQPGPSSMPQQPDMQVWSVSSSGGLAPRMLGTGDAPAISPDGTRVAFTNDGAVMIAPIDGSAPAKRLFFDRGQDSDLRWSPDGSALAFVSTRTDHSFIGIYRNDSTPLQFLAPTTAQDIMPRWSPDGASIAFIRAPGDGGAPQNPLNWNVQPWQIWVADARTGAGRLVWSSPKTLRGSLPQTAGGPFLDWVAADQLVFKGEQDNWPHLYAVSANGGPARLLTPGPFMVEDNAISPDLRSAIYSANTGSIAGDDDRRHSFRVDVTTGTITQLASGASSEWQPVGLADNGAAFDRATAQQPPLVTVLSGGTQRALNSLSGDFPSSELVTPREVSFRAPDGRLIYGQLFEPSSGGKHPGIIFVHGGPPRQMLLTWHYFDYYSNAYAVNQYLASRGFAVLSVNYRLGIGYGHDFNFPARWGPTGASEYQDVVAGARFLQQQPNVDPNRIGIWGGSYGGYLTALALARNSNIFKAGVDFHGVHDWSLDIDNPVWAGTQLKRYQQYDESAMMKLAWESSPDSAIATWKSPVLLIQGDDDRNVEFHQMVDLVERLRLTHVPFEQIVIPNEIHGFLRYASWLQADSATADYFARKLGLVSPVNR
jgi:dipeptidyl aminopeptidase/acylaminoacyl peptidase